MKIVSRAETEHHCAPGKTFVTVTEEEAAQPHPSGFPQMAGTFIVDDEDQRGLPGGSVIQCEVCGKFWVKEPVEWHHTRGKKGRGMAWFSDNDWRPETKREMKKRERELRS